MAWVLPAWPLLTQALPPEGHPPSCQLSSTLPLRLEARATVPSPCEAPDSRFPRTHQGGHLADDVLIHLWMGERLLGLASVKAPRRQGEGSPHAAWESSVASGQPGLPGSSEACMALAVCSL